MRQLSPRLVRLARAAARDVLLTAVPHGGQRAARRNAWVGMSADAARSRAGREAATAIRDAEVRAQHPAGGYPGRRNGAGRHPVAAAR